MKVITGTARGAKLIAPDLSLTRPTSGLVKEAIFNILQFEVLGAKVLDLFAGSGQLGVEALSRGASEAVFVEGNASARRVILKNLEHTKLSENGVVLLQRAEDFLVKNRRVFDIAILDPPYGCDLVSKIMPALVKSMAPGGVIICEMARKDSVAESFGAWHLTKTHFYGKKKLLVFRQEEQEK